MPVWALVYHCLRCGDIEAAVTAASNAGQGLAEVQRLLSEMSSGGTGRLSPQSEAHVRLAYRRSIRAATDPFKRAVYCVLAACDPSDEHAEVRTEEVFKSGYVRTYRTSVPSSLGGLVVGRLPLAKAVPDPRRRSCQQQHQLGHVVLPGLGPRGYLDFAPAADPVERGVRRGTL